MSHLSEDAGVLFGTAGPFLSKRFSRAPHYPHFSHLTLTMAPIRNIPFASIAYVLYSNVLVLQKVQNYLPLSPSVGPGLPSNP